MHDVRCEFACAVRMRRNNIANVLKYSLLEISFRPFGGQIEDILDFPSRLNRLAAAALTWLKFPNNLTRLEVGYDEIMGLYFMIERPH